MEVINRMPRSNRSRGRRKNRWVKVVGSIAILVLVILLAGIGFLNVYINDRSIDVGSTLIADQDEQRLLVVFAHPDDEVVVAGTLSKLSKQGVDITLVYLTRGEAGPTGDIVERGQLGAKRTQEVEHIADILGVSGLEVFDFPDGGLVDTDEEEIKGVIRDMIAKYSPSTILTTDDKVGLYGHMDHLLAGKYVREVFNEDREQEDFTANRLFFATLPQPMIDTALKISQTFKERYPTEPGAGLPKPTLAIKMPSEAGVKNKVILAHETQWQVMNDVQPLYDKLPPFIYYRSSIGSITH